jgi:drug/metabolite transporter (DMT)-like permease
MSAPTSKTRRFWSWFIALSVGLFVVARLGLVIWLWFFVDDFSESGTYGTTSGQTQMALIALMLAVSAIASYLISQRGPKP